MSCGGFLMNKSVFYPYETALVPTHRAWGTLGLGGLRDIRAKNPWLAHATAGAASTFRCATKYASLQLLWSPF